ncbi:MAG TPA: DUF4395 domain-containing protein [Thermoleophilaceae bacterium]|jgi:hypothetical protein|nr:DUF4395 domain-containing protein [Thermoleophilaceae bacterium]
MARVFGFPNPVNEKAARTVAVVVFATSIAALAASAYWLLIPLAYGFWARVLTGPALSPLGRFATKVAAPRLGQPKYVSGPPKRFAQGIGAAMSTAALVAWAVVGATSVADVLLAMLVVASGLEAVFALCLGCRLFALLMRIGVIPESVCAECNDIWSRRPGAVFRFTGGRG